MSKITRSSQTKLVDVQMIRFSWRSLDKVDPACRDAWRERKRSWSMCWPSCEIQPGGTEWTTISHQYQHKTLFNLSHVKFEFDFELG